MDNPDAGRDRRLQRLHLPGRRLGPDGRATTRPAAGHLRHGDEAGIKYLLSTAVIEGTELDRRRAPGIPQNAGQLAWSASTSTATAARRFADVSGALVNTGQQFAIVLDGQVISAPTMNALITNGQAQITGNFTEATRPDLATSLKFGALPIAFENDADASRRSAPRWPATSSPRASSPAASACSW